MKPRLNQHKTTIFLQKKTDHQAPPGPVSLRLRKVRDVSLVHAPHEAQVATAEIAVDGAQVLDHGRQHRQVDRDGNDWPQCFTQWDVSGLYKWIIWDDMGL